MDISSLNRQKKQELYRAKIKEAYALYCEETESGERLGPLDKNNLPYVMRYLGMFPSEPQVKHELESHAHLTKEEDRDSKTLPYEKVEQFLLDMLLTAQYQPSTYERLMAAFRVFDKKNNGQIKVDQFRNLVANSKLMYKEEEIKDLLEFLPKDPTGKYFYYEDYVARLVEGTQKHVKNLFKVGSNSRDK